MTLSHPMRSDLIFVIMVNRFAPTLERVGVLFFLKEAACYTLIILKK